MFRKLPPLRRLRPIAMALPVLIYLLSPHAAAADVKRVMILHSFGREFKPWSEYGKVIRTELERLSPWPVDIVDHSIVSARLGGEDVEARFVDYLRAQFAKDPLDLIVSIGAPAAGFVQRYRNRFFADTPMVLTAIDQRRVQFSQLTSNDTVSAVRINYLAAFKNILQVLPATENVMVVVGTSPIEKFWKEAIAEEVKPLSERIRLSWTDHLSFEQLLREASKLPPRTAIFWELLIVDAAGVVHEGNSAIGRLHAAANAPMFSYDESFFGDGMVGGPFLHVIDTSRQTAEIAIRILRGERAGDIKVAPVQFASPVYDWRQMQRWNIGEAQLPSGSTIRFGEPTPWELYRWQITGIILALLFQAALIYWLLHERRRRQTSEELVRGTMARLHRANRVAAGSELSATIAHEVMQPLTGMVSSANAGIRWLSAAKPDLDKARAMLEQVVAAGHQTADVVRSMRGLLKSKAIVAQPVDLHAVIETVFEIVRAQLDEHGIASDVLIEDSLPIIYADQTQLQQVFLNLVANAIDAMAASPAVQQHVLRVRCWTQGDEIRATIEDTGPGIAADQFEQIFKPLFTTKDHGTGLGLSICRSIVEAHHGRIWVAQAEPRGLAVHVALPITQAGS